MKIRFFILSILLFGSFISASAQVYSAIGQISRSSQDTFVRDISGDGRLVVLESTGNIATENPDNADLNREIFLYDYAQRRIFQITHTKSMLTDTTLAATNSNIKIMIENQRASISNDGRWIAFSSNANGSVCTPPYGGATTCTSSTANPGDFDANTFTPTTGTNPLLNDANNEIYLYNVPAIASVDLSSGAELPLTNLSGGTFTRVTNTPASRLPVAGTATELPIVAYDNRDVTLDDTGDTLAFTSTRDIVNGGNSYPASDNSEIFIYKRSLASFGQVTTTPRGTVISPTWNMNPAISGNGQRVAFIGTGHNPVTGMTGGNNDSTVKNEEIFYTDLTPTGSPIGTSAKQITVTTPTTRGDVTNIFISGRRLSRDGRFIAFDSVAELSSVTPIANSSTIATFVYDINATETSTANKYRQIGPRGSADPTLGGADVLHFPTFSDYDSLGSPLSLIMVTRSNIRPDGSIPTTDADGLNPSTSRPTQTYRYPLNSTHATGTFTRITQIPPSGLISLEPFPANSSSRMAFSLRDTELGTGNFDYSSEGYYIFSPIVTRRPKLARMSFSTGASDRTVVSEVVTDPTPIPTPTVSPTPTPSVTPSPTPTPTPINPPAVQGISPGMLASFDPIVNVPLNITPGYTLGSNSQSTPLPLEMNGVSMTIADVACGIRSVSNSKIYFVVPLGLPGGYLYEFKANLNGTLIVGTVAITPVQPDIFTRDLPIPGPLGRADAVNATNRVHTFEPFSVRTLKFRGGLLVPTVLRVYLTGVEGVQSSQASLRIGDQTVSASLANAVRTDIPGRYYLDFALPASARGIGDVPIVIYVTFNGAVYKSRLDDAASRIQIL